MGHDVVWALDTMGRLSVRREVQSNVFPEGTHWQTLPAMPNDPIHIGITYSLSVTYSPPSLLPLASSLVNFIF